MHCVYVHVCTCICMHVVMHGWVSICVCRKRYVCYVYHTYGFMHMYGSFMCIMSVCVHIYTCFCMFVYMYTVCKYTNIYSYVHVYHVYTVWAYVHVYMYTACMDEQIICVYNYVYMYMLYVLIYVHECIHAHRDAGVKVIKVHICQHTQTHH